MRASTTLHFRNFRIAEAFLTELPTDSLIYAPHCLRRDLNSPMMLNNTNQTTVDRLLASENIHDFQFLLSDSGPLDSAWLSPHVGGHWAIGQDLRDVFTSPGDPAFWLHHGMIDNLWTQWQNKDLESRRFALDGTVTSFNNPPSQDATLDYVLDWGYVGKPRRVGELMDTKKGPYCYRYNYVEGAPRPEQW